MTSRILDIFRSPFPCHVLINQEIRIDVTKPLTSYSLRMWRHLWTIPNAKENRDIMNAMFAFDVVERNLKCQNWWDILWPVRMLHSAIKSQSFCLIRATQIIRDYFLALFLQKSSRDTLLTLECHVIFEWPLTTKQYVNASQL